MTVPTPPPGIGQPGGFQPPNITGGPTVPGGATFGGLPQGRAMVGVARGNRARFGTRWSLTRDSEPALGREAKRAMGLPDDWTTSLYGVAPPPARPSTGEPPELERSGVQMPDERTFETQPADEVLKSLFHMSKPALRALQRQMFDAGFYGNHKWEEIVHGFADPVTFETFANVIEDTVNQNAQGVEITWTEYLENTLRLRREQGTNFLDENGQPRQPERAPFVAELTAPDDIERTAQFVARRLLGERADPALVQRIVSEYRATEQSAQRSAYDTAPVGGTVTAPPSIETFAEEAIEEADPTAVEGYRVANDFAGVLDELLAGPFGG